MFEIEDLHLPYPHSEDDNVVLPLPLILGLTSITFLTMIVLLHRHFERGKKLSSKLCDHMS